MLGMSTPHEWDAWLRTVDRIADLSPKIIAAGHKRTDADDRAAAEMVSSTRAYITYFRDAVRDGVGADTLVTELTARFTGHGNRSTSALFGGRRHRRHSGAVRASRAFTRARGPE